MTTTAATATSGTSNSSYQAYLAQQTANAAATKVATASGTSSSALAQATSTSAIGSNFNTFINILTTQLKSQDPTNATDPNQFTQELVQFAGVEQQLNTNNDLQTLINLNKSSNGTTAALNYIGKSVDVTTTGNQLALQSGVGEVGYNLGTSGAKATVTVSDSTGKTVATLSGSANTGMNYIKWDGKDSSGNQLPDGTYSFALAVKNVDNSTNTPTAIHIIGQVTGITSNTDGTTNLSFGGLSLATSSVNAAYTSGNAPAATTASS